MATILQDLAIILQVYPCKISCKSWSHARYEQYAILHARTIQESYKICCGNLARSARESCYVCTFIVAMVTNSSTHMLSLNLATQFRQCHKLRIAKVQKCYIVLWQLLYYAHVHLHCILLSIFIRNSLSKQDAYLYTFRLPE